MKTSASVKEFVAMLKDADESVRIFAALRLGSLGAEAPKRRFLPWPNCSTARTSSTGASPPWRWGRSGRLRNGAGLLLVEALGDADDGVRKFAAEAIRKIDATAAKRRAA